MMGFHMLSFQKIKNKKFILNLKILMEKLLTYIMLSKNILKIYTFNSFLKTIIYFVKLFIVFLFINIENRIQIKLNNFISKKYLIYQIIQSMGKNIKEK